MASVDYLKEKLQDLQLDEAMMMIDYEDALKLELLNLQKQLEKKQSFEEAVASIKSILIQYYSSASPSLQESIYFVVCRVATILQTRYTAPRFWFAGKGLFEEAENLVNESLEKEHLKTCIARTYEHLYDVNNQSTALESPERGPGYLFEGHLTVDPEPPQPQWLVKQNYLYSILTAAESSQCQRESSITTEGVSQSVGKFLHSVDCFYDADYVTKTLQDHKAMLIEEHRLSRNNTTMLKRKKLDYVI